MPQPSGNSAITAVLSRVMDKYWRGMDVSNRSIPPIALNNEAISAANAAYTGTVEVARVDASNRVVLGGVTQNLVTAAGAQAMAVPAIYTLEPNGSLADQGFYIANQSMLVLSIYETHRVAGGSTPTAVIKKCASGVTIANGTALMTNTFDLAATAVTEQAGVLSSTLATVTLAAGDMLAIDYTGTLTSLAGVCVTVWMMPLTSPTLDVTFAWNSNTQLIDSQFFIANDRYVVTAARWRHATLGTDGSAVGAMLSKDSSTNAPGAGTDMLTAAFDCKGTINVPQTGALSATAATLLLAAGDRLAVDFSGTTTALAGVVMTVSMTPIANRLEIPFYIPSTWAANTDQCFFHSDGDYIAIGSSEIHAIAAGGASTAQVTKDSTTDAPGAGLDLLTSADNMNSTAQTVVNNLLVTTFGYTRLRRGDRLSYDFANAVQSSSGLCVTVSLRRP